MLKLHKREELKEILYRKSPQNNDLSKLQRSALMQLDNHTTEELQSNQKAPGGSPAHIRINLQQFALPKIQHTTNIKTNKYIGEYNNMLGIITSKHQIPYRNCTYRSASYYSILITFLQFTQILQRFVDNNSDVLTFDLYHNTDQFIEKQNYVINQFIRPRKLGTFK